MNSEESAHAPQQKWICGPREFSHTTTQTTTSPCPLCEELGRYPLTDGINISNTCPHGFNECWAKPESARTFFRKDALHQHLVNIHTKTVGHSCLVRRLNLDRWSHSVETSGYDLKCHFCGGSNDSWDERYKHILAHFEDGVTMDQWRPRYILDYNQEENLDPPFACMGSRNEPFKIPKHFEHGMCMPQWCRDTGDGLEGWCGVCRPGRWLNISSFSFEHDRSILHGISMKTGTSFPDPMVTRWTITHGIEGLCAQCGSWIVMKRNAYGEESWFAHSFHVRNFPTHPPQGKLTSLTARSASFRKPPRSTNSYLERWDHFSAVQPIMKSI